MKGRCSRKKAAVFLILVLFVTMLVPPALASERHPFTDVPENQWFSSYVALMYEHDIMLGTAATTFAPHSKISRAMTIATLFRIEHGRIANADDPAETHFTDTPEGQWFSPYVAWSARNEIDSGTSADTFHPERDATRQEFARMMYRFAKHMGHDTAISSEHHLGQFTDRDAIDDSAMDAVLWATYHEIILGRTTSTIVPNAYLTRAEAAAILMRFLQLTDGERFPISPVLPPIQPPIGNEQYEMDRWFSVYAQPDYRAERIACFGPQTITVRRERSDGWALIATYRGEYWTNLREHRRLIEQITGLYEYQGAALPIGPLEPQLVQVLDRDENWLQIATWQGPMWIDLNFTIPTQPLEQMLNRHGNRVSIYFQNLETGFTFRHNADRIYASASVPKAPFAMYIFEKADRGETDLNRTLRFTTGRFLTQHELLRRMLVYSCNDSTHVLRNFHGAAGYRAWAESIGNNPAWVANTIMGSRLTIDETARFAHAIYHYIESDAEHSDVFRTHLLNNQFPFIVSDYPIASKTGWLRALLHDMAIVYADSPYILVVLSDGISRAAIREISMAFQHFNDAWF